MGKLRSVHSVHWYASIKLKRLLFDTNFIVVTKQIQLFAAMNTMLVANIPAAKKYTLDLLILSFSASR